MSNAQFQLPATVDGFLRAVNAFDTAAVLREFADDALVNDIRREFWGRQAIGRWIETEVVGVRVTLTPQHFREHYGDVAVTCRVEGNFDKTGLPDPLLLTFYFTLRLTAEGDRIVQLIILRNEATSVQPEQHVA